MWKYRCQRLSVPEYDIEFFAVSEKQNYQKIFNKYKIKNAVDLSCKACELYNVEIIDGKKIFKKMATDYVRKYLKSCGEGASVTFVDKSLKTYTEEFVDLLCDVCDRINLCTMCSRKGEELCDKIMKKYGAVINVMGNEEKIKSDVVVIVDNFDVVIDEKCVVIGDSFCTASNRKVWDFYIPFRVKVPFDMPRTVFAECVQLAGKKSI